MSARIWKNIFIGLCSFFVAAMACGQSRHISLDLVNLQAKKDVDNEVAMDAYTLPSRITANYTSDEIAQFSSEIVNPLRQLLVVAINADNQVLSRVVIKNPFIRIIETFDPDTGQNEYSELIEQSEGYADLVIPDHKDLSHLVLYKKHNDKLVELQRIAVGKPDEKKAMRSMNMAAASSEGVKVLYNGDPSNRSDLVFVAEGYTASEMSKFARDVDKVVKGFFAATPFKEYKNQYNVWRVEAVSNVSGAGLNGRGIGTKFNAYFGCNGIDRLLCADTRSATNYAKSRLPANAVDEIIVVVNHSKYGGSGGSSAVMSTHSAAIDLALHESAHSYAGLADEYTSNGYGCSLRETSAPNVTRTYGAKWERWKGAESVGWFEGADYCERGAYRSARASMMRNMGEPFYQVNSEAIILKTYDYVDLIDSASPSVSTLSAINSQTFTVDTVNPEPNTVEVNWSVNGRHAGTGNRFTMTKSQYKTGKYTVKASVKDASEMIRTQTSKITDSKTWTVNFTADEIGGCEELTSAPIGLKASNITATEFSSSWSALKNADAYQIEQKIDGRWFEYTVGKTSYAFTNQTPNSSTVIRVRASNECSTSPYSKEVSVKLPDTTPNCDSVQVVGTLTASDITSTSFTVSWKPTKNAVSYTPEFKVKGVWQAQDSVKEPKASYSHLEANSEHFIRVVAENSCGDKAEPSSWIAVLLEDSEQCSVPAKPKKPVASDIGDSSYTLTWQALPAAKKYQIQRWTEASKIWKDYAISETTTMKITGEPENIAYSRVIGINSCGETGEPSDYATVELNSCTAPSTPSRPKAKDVGEKSYTMYWSSVSGATSYQVQLWSETAKAYQDYQTTNETSLKVSVDDKKESYARVKAISSCGAKSDGSPYVKVLLDSTGQCTSAPSKPVGLKLSRGYLVWSAVEQATHYKIMAWSYRSNNWVNYRTVTTPYISITRSTPYYLTVRAGNSCGKSSYTDYIQVR